MKILKYLFKFQINLRKGVPENCLNETCTSGAGTLLLEFGVLSRLLDDPIYESVARRAVNSLWKYKSNVTGLLGMVIFIMTPLPLTLLSEMN